MREAGASARREHRRRLSRRRRRLAVLLLATAASGTLAWTVHGPVRAVAGGVTIVLLSVSLRLRPGAGTWRRGAEGETATARLLEPLVRRGYTVLHDRLIPGTSANIDHVVIGPTGVFVVETKAWRGRVRIRFRSLLINGRKLNEALEQVLIEAHVVARVLSHELRAAGVEPIPVLCVHGARLPRVRRSVRGVRVAGGRRLRRLLRRGRRVLGPDEVAMLVHAADARLTRAAPGRVTL